LTIGSGHVSIKIPTNSLGYPGKRTADRCASRPRAATAYAPWWIWRYTPRVLPCPSRRSPNAKASPSPTWSRSSPSSGGRAGDGDPRAHGRLYAGPAEEISAGEILRVLEGDTAPVYCVERMATRARCAREPASPTREFWRELRDHIDAFLDRTSLRELCERARRKDEAPPMYYI